MNSLHSFMTYKLEGCVDGRRCNNTLNVSQPYRVSADSADSS